MEDPRIRRYFLFLSISTLLLLFTCICFSEKRREHAQKYSLENAPPDDAGNLGILANVAVIEKEKEDLEKEVDELLNHFNDYFELQYQRMKEKIKDQQQKINNLYSQNEYEKIKKQKIKLQKMGEILIEFCDTSATILERNFGIIDSL
ncbi:hypothetical protein V8G54_016807 [Vigna mungo]|uniref:Uncharacterized protein n=1 Tax=Vigna mungo TaxID=3915 RepID=A0AAQ3NPI4_VIGMU